MISELVSQSGSKFDSQFYLNALIPTAVFAPSIAITVLVGRGQFGSVVQWYDHQAVAVQFLGALGALAAIWFLATLLASQWTSIVRLFEGYPLSRTIGMVNRWLSRRGSIRLPVPGVAAHKIRLFELRKRANATSTVRHDASAMDLKYDRYPPQMGRVLPTGLGNMLRAAEDYGPQRYGFNTIALWPRLAVVLPESHRAQLDNAIMRYQLPLVVAFCSSLLSMATFMLCFGTVRTLTFQLAFLSTATFSYATYRLSFGAARDYGAMLRSAIDLYRDDLLEKWWPELLKLDDSRQRLEALATFVIEGKRIHPVGGHTVRTSGSFVPSPAAGQGGAGVTTTTTDDWTPQDSKPKRFGIRLRTAFFAFVALLCAAGSIRLSQKTEVIRAKFAADAFNDVTTEAVSIPRHDVPHGALAPGELKGARAVALSTIEKHQVLRASDVVKLPPEQTRAWSVFAVSQPSGVVQALALRPGDRVEVAVGPAEATGHDAAATHPVPGQVISVAAGSDGGAVVTLFVCSADVRMLGHADHAVVLVRPDVALSQTENGEHNEPDQEGDQQEADYCAEP